MNIQSETMDIYGRNLSLPENTQRDAHTDYYSPGVPTSIVHMIYSEYCSCGFISRLHCGLMIPIKRTILQLFEMSPPSFPLVVPHSQLNLLSFFD